MSHYYFFLKNECFKNNNQDDEWRTFKGQLVFKKYVTYTWERSAFPWTNAKLKCNVQFTQIFHAKQIIFCKMYTSKYNQTVNKIHLIKMYRLSSCAISPGKSAANSPYYFVSCLYSTSRKKILPVYF